MARIGLAVVILLITAGVAGSSGELAVQVISLTVALVVGGFLMASTRLGVEVDGTGVRVLRLARTEVYSWNEISHFKVGDHRARLTGERATRPLLVLRSGREVPLPGLEDFDPIGTAPLKGVAARVARLESARTSRGH